MTAAPKREPAREHGAAQSLTQALVSHAAARASGDARQLHIERAREQAASEFAYQWETEDGRDVLIRVYFAPGTELEILAAEVMEVDQRPPTTMERERFELAFEEEMLAAGALWEHVTSYVRERAG